MMEPKLQVEVHFPKLFYPVATEIGEELRLRRNKQLEEGKLSAKTFRDEKDERTIYALGTLGEMVARYALDLRGIEYSAVPLLTNRPVNQPDIVIYMDGTKYLFDVKAIKEGGSSLYLTERNLVKMDDVITDYMFVRFIRECKAQIWTCPKETVGEWPQAKWKYADDPVRAWEIPQTVT